MLARVSSVALLGVEGRPLVVEVHVSGGLPGVVVVGLADRAVRESRDRVRAALVNSGYEPPRRKTTVNLAPSDIPKEGSAYDLPIAIGILSASGQMDLREGEGTFWAGELSLDGAVRPVRGVLPMAVAVRREGGRTLVVPRANVAEAGVVEGVKVVGVSSLAEAAAFAAGTREPPAGGEAAAAARPEPAAGTGGSPGDFAEVRGQAVAKRALVLAAAGGHNVLLCGPPGAGKSMLARCLPSILPPMEPQEALETTCVHSVAGALPEGVRLLRERPFRDPHHTISAVALVGGGAMPRPGEISLAHHGVLFLDELPEFPRRTLETLRQPMESGVVPIGRAAGRARFPARFMLVAAMNPCPCGNLGNPRRACRCPPAQVRRYLGQLSGPLLDRIDLKLEVTPPPPGDLLGGGRPSAGSEPMRKAVARARAIQARRALCEEVSHPNAFLDPRGLHRVLAATPAALSLAREIAVSLSLSARSVHRLLKLSRTIADVEGREPVGPQDVAEAAQYRLGERVGLEMAS